MRSTTGIERFEHMGFDGKGVQYYVDECVRLEQRFQAIQTEAARVAPGDPRLEALRSDGEGLVQRLTRMEGDVTAEVGRMWAFHDNEANRKGTGLLASLLAPGVKGEYRAQFDDAQLLYDEVLSVIRLTRDDWRTWLAGLGGSRRTPDGLVLCAHGHENHPSRSTCLVCGQLVA